MIIGSIHTNAIIKELPTEGHSPLLVLGSDYEMYVAKNDKGKEPLFALINECLASYCLNKWNIASPNTKLISVIHPEESDKVAELIIEKKASKFLQEIQ